ncbi:zinc-binding dehydrogenase [Trichoderma arundinaceum]|uniref:Zinc-binding dehydrogenase n=1 Tax=Trichoderma arundinaceum TaxID=490622 RepID=A0A395NI94_TRIAR|nr:zinc-binding dehydrogenase [Trichoderma arundinaceum]
MAIPNRKVVISSYGPASTSLQIVTESLAPPPKDHVQVKICYAGFAGADVNMRLGQYPFQRSAPLTPGYCFSGRVSVNGPGCSKFKAGDLVTALTKYDADAEYINIPEKYLVPVPAGVDLQQAAALCLDWATAYGMVHRSANVSAGQRVFIHGISGAVGQGVMYLCLLQGATVYGTAAERNHAALKEAGAHPFVYTNKDWIPAMKEIGGVHAVFDALGFESFDESYSILSPTERSIVVAFGSNLGTLTNGKSRSPWVPIFKLLAKSLYFWSNKTTTFFGIQRDQKTFQPELQTLLGMVQKGTIHAPIKHIWDFEDIKEAHETWGKGAGMGSYLIRIAPDA